MGGFLECNSAPRQRNGQAEILQLISCGPPNPQRPPVKGGHYPGQRRELEENGLLPDYSHDRFQ